jgi:hypothetical protein
MSAVRMSLPAGAGRDRIGRLTFMTDAALILQLPLRSR